MVNLISDYIPPFSPMPNIAPFTYKDGETYLSELNRIKDYVNNILVKFINDSGINVDSNINDLIVAVNNALTEQSNSVNDAISAQNTDVENRLNTQSEAINTQITTLTNYVNEQIAAIIGSSVDVAEGVILQVVNNNSSDVRVVLDNLYADKGSFTTAQTNIQAISDNVDTTFNGRLSDTTLSNEFANKATQNTVETGRLSTTELDNTYSAKEIETLVTSGRLSDTNLSAEFSSANLSGTYSARPLANTVKAGTIYYCTNIPETYRSDGINWSVVGSGGSELGYAIDLVGGSTTAATNTNITALSVTFVAGERPLLFRVSGDIANSSATAVTSLNIALDGAVVLTVVSVGIGADVWHSVYGTSRKTGLTPGSTHTITASYKTNVATSTTARYSAGTSLQVVTL